MSVFPHGTLENVNMAKIYERLLSTNILREKRRVSFDPKRENLLGEDSICMVNLLETPRVFFITCSLFTVSATYLIEKRREA